MEACVFCEIGTGRIDHEVVFAVDTVLAFLCELPATWRHTLVAPSKHRQDIWTIEPSEAQTAMALAQRPAHVMHDHLGAVGVNLPPREPPAGGDPERRRVAEVLRRGLAG